MLLMTKQNIIDIYNHKKIKTLRPIKPNHKGYLKVGSVQTIKLTLYSDWYLKVRITKRKIRNLDELTDQDFKELGYPSKQAYLKEKFNQTNKSNLRIEYTFQILEYNIQNLMQLQGGKK